MNFDQKYLKYKNKYISKATGGSTHDPIKNIYEEIDALKKEVNKHSYHIGNLLNFQKLQQSVQRVKSTQKLSRESTLSGDLTSNAFLRKHVDTNW